MIPIASIPVPSEIKRRLESLPPVCAIVRSLASTFEEWVIVNWSFVERVKVYTEERFPYKIYKIGLKDEKRKVG